MNYELLMEIGLSSSQAKAYIALVENGELTPPELAEKIDEKRTTAYMALDKLERIGLISKKELEKKTIYQAKSPSTIRNLLIKRQTHLREIGNDIQGALPNLIAKYNLAYRQPGISTLEGINGLRVVFQDIIRVRQPIMILPSRYDRDDIEVANLIDRQIIKQKENGIEVRVISSSEAHYNKDDMSNIKNKDSSVDVRILPNFTTGVQLIIYGDNVAITSFKGTPLTTIITSSEIAATIAFIFETLWSFSGQISEI